ncbi:MAG: hypothetical protein HY597_05355 [Candidatus Omnitrophica bacterium]|nr:hypothetical protein [Candidatus Omnitrophota bacterium]
MKTTVIGNYPKVAEDSYGTKVIGALNRWQKGEVNNEDLEQVFSETTASVIAEQEAAGIDIITDGQIRWEDLVTPLAKRVDGFSINGLTRFYNNNVYYRQPILERAPRWKGPALVDDFRKAKALVKRAALKAVIPGPWTFTQLIEDRHFKQPVKCMQALAEILHQEAKALAEAGAAFVQIDEPSVGATPPPAASWLKAMSTITKGLPAKTSARFYFYSPDGLFAKLQDAAVDAIGLDIVSDPKLLGRILKVRWHKALGLGCVDARNTKLETIADLRKLFDRVTKVVPADQLFVSPNCGLEFLPHDKAIAKLRLMVDAVRQWQRG